MERKKVKQDWEDVNQFLQDRPKPCKCNYYIKYPTDSYGAVAFAYENKKDEGKPRVIYHKDVSSDYPKNYPNCKVCTAKELKCGFDAATKIVSVQGANEKISQEDATLYRDLGHLVK